MPVMNTDAALWYNVDLFGELGYAVPNPSNDVGSLNPQILEFVEVGGRNLFRMMHHEDVDLRVPISINSVLRVHRLYVRLGQLLAAGAVPPAELNMETDHVSPNGEVFKVFPVPYFKVRNQFMKKWCGLVLAMLSEAMQHTENRKQTEISTHFAGKVGQYMSRIYREMAVKFFGKTREQVRVDGFLLSDEDFATYDPSRYFTSSEMIDTVPHLGHVFTEDRLEVLSEGIPVTSLPALQPWPTNLTSYYLLNRPARGANADAINTSSDPSATAPASAGGGPIIPPPPAP